ncbi:MAG TPA: hypothetical protein VF989_20100 [Polyangiaceae bacterium]
MRRTKRIRAGSVLLACHGVACSPQAWGGPPNDGEPAREAVPPGIDPKPLLSRLHEERVRRGLSSPEIVARIEPLESALRMIRAGSEPRSTFHHALQRMADDETSDLLSWVTPVESLEQVRFPAPLLQREDVTLSVAVARYQKGYVVCWVLFEGGYEVESAR